MTPRERERRSRRRAREAGTVESYEDPAEIPSTYRPEDPNDYDALQEQSEDRGARW